MVRLEVKYYLPGAMSMMTVFLPLESYSSKVELTFV